MLGKKIALIALLVLALLVAGCGEEAPTEPIIPDYQPTPECTVNEDCTATEACQQAICASGVCVTSTKDFCCGNDVCEEGEDVCTCPSDCTEGCDGKVEFTNQYEAKVNSKYFTYGCVMNKCGIKYNPSQIKPNQAYHDLKQDNLALGLTVSYIQPFEINHGTVDIELQLKDYNSDYVTLPITITEVRVMDNSILLGRAKMFDKSLKAIGSTYTVQVPISYAMSLPEEEKTVSVQLDYQIMKVQKVARRDGNGQYMYDDLGQPIYMYINDTLAINTFKQTLAERITFIDPNYDRVKVDFSQ